MTYNHPDNINDVIWYSRFGYNTMSTLHLTTVYETDAQNDKSVLCRREITTRHTQKKRRTYFITKCSFCEKNVMARLSLALSVGCLDRANSESVILNFTHNKFVIPPFSFLKIFKYSGRYFFCNLASNNSFRLFQTFLHI